MLERYAVGLVVLPQVSHTSQLQNAWLGHLRQALDERGTRYRFANAGQQMQLNGLVLDILHPALGQQFVAKTNNASISVKGNYCAAGPVAGIHPHDVLTSFRASRGAPTGATRGSCLSFLLTGDAEAAVERQLAGKYGSVLRADVLKAGHHGSKTSTSRDLLEAAAPSAVIISAGRDNQYGHPHPDILERLKNYHLWRTDQQGSVRFVHKAGRWLVRTGR